MGADRGRAIVGGFFCFGGRFGGGVNFKPGRVMLRFCASLEGDRGGCGRGFQASNMIDDIVDRDIGIQPCQSRYGKGWILKPNIRIP